MTESDFMDGRASISIKNLELDDKVPSRSQFAKNLLRHTIRKFNKILRETYEPNRKEKKEEK